MVLKFYDASFPSFYTKMVVIGLTDYKPCTLILIIWELIMINIDISDSVFDEK